MKFPERRPAISYYTSIIFLSLAALSVLCILVRENGRMQTKYKKLYYLTYLLIGLAALAEWGGIILNGREGLPRWPLQIVKCADYILTPMAGGSMITQMDVSSRWRRALFAVLAANTGFQFVAFFTGWTVRIDASNHYSHGPLYGVYMLSYMAVIILLSISCVKYGKVFRRQNRSSLYATMLLILAGIAVQELMGADLRTAYISLTLGAALLYIHNTEFSQMLADDHLLEQQIQISTDALTGLFSRHAYSKALGDSEAAGGPAGDFAAFSIDINDLKMVNDKKGHAAGDELICGAAQCIRQVFDRFGSCYRTGGDEFIVFANMSRSQADAALEALRREADQWSGTMIKKNEMKLSAGYALVCDHPGLTAERLVIEADQAMYADKRAFYMQNGRDRRNRR